MTKEQENCKYCHEPFKFIGDSDAGFRIDPYDETIDYYDAFGDRFEDGCKRQENQFSFCPMCGRELGV